MRTSHAILALLLAAAVVGAADDPRILERAPESPDPAAHYLFYLHGRIIEVQGPDAVSPDFGPYAYRQILEAFADRGFVVVAEVREDGAGREFAVATAKQVRGLLEAGVPPGHVTVVGFSKGGYLALGTSAIVGAEKVSYAILAGCGSDARWLDRLGPRIRGRFLSLYDRSDRMTPSCEPLFARAELVDDKTEHVYNTGLDHGLFYRPRTDWIGSVADWARVPSSAGGDTE